MKRYTISALILLTACGVCAAPAPDRPVLRSKADDIQIPAADADEPKVKTFDKETVRAAATYLDEGAVAWTRSKSCIACHTTGAYMAERPSLTKMLGPPSEEVLEDFVDGIAKAEETSKGQKTFFKRADRSIWRSLGLAEWDKHVMGKLSDHTARSLRDMLLRQLDDGSWHVGGQTEIPHVTTDFELALQAARAVAAAPGWLDQLEDDDLRERVERMKTFLREHKPRNDYERVLKLQLASVMPELVPGPEIEEAVALLRRQQQPDGGWSTRRMSDIRNWRDEVEPRIVELLQSEPDADDPASDPYMTGFAIVLLRESGVPATDEQIRRGIAWLKANQRQSGRWWMKSLYKGNYHFTTYIATAQALKALALCGELDGDLASSGGD